MKANKFLGLLQWGLHKIYISVQKVESFAASSRCCWVHGGMTCNKMPVDWRGAGGEGAIFACGRRWLQRRRRRRLRLRDCGCGCHSSRV